MTTDRQFTHPNFGNEARVELNGCEVRLVFIATNRATAESLALTLLEQLQAGAVNITMMGIPTSVVEDHP
jgi:hypothetical protein